MERQISHIHDLVRLLNTHLYALNWIPPRPHLASLLRPMSKVTAVLMNILMPRNCLPTSGHIPPGVRWRMLKWGIVASYPVIDATLPSRKQTIAASKKISIPPRIRAARRMLKFTGLHSIPFIIPLTERITPGIPRPTSNTVNFAWRPVLPLLQKMLDSRRSVAA